MEYYYVLLLLLLLVLTEQGIWWESAENRDRSGMLTIPDGRQGLLSLELVNFTPVQRRGSL